MHIIGWTKSSNGISQSHFGICSVWDCTVKAGTTIYLFKKAMLHNMAAKRICFIVEIKFWIVATVFYITYSGCWEIYKTQNYSFQSRYEKL